MGHSKHFQCLSNPFSRAPNFNSAQKQTKVHLDPPQTLIGGPKHSPKPSRPIFPRPTLTPPTNEPSSALHVGGRFQTADDSLHYARGH